MILNDINIVLKCRLMTKDLIYSEIGIAFTSRCFRKIKELYHNLLFIFQNKVIYLTSSYQISLIIV